MQCRVSEKNRHTVHRNQAQCVCRLLSLVLAARIISKVVIFPVNPVFVLTTPAYECTQLPASQHISEDTDVSKLLDDLRML